MHPNPIRIQYLHLSETAPGTGVLDVAWVPEEPCWPMQPEHASLAVRDWQMTPESLRDNAHLPDELCYCLTEYLRTGRIEYAAQTYADRGRWQAMAWTN